jgi:hypothetical protein
MSDPYAKIKLLRRKDTECITTMTATTGRQNVPNVA